MCTPSQDRCSTRTNRVALPFCYKTLTAKKPSEKPYPRELVTLGDHLRKRRLDLNLLQRDVAVLLDVDTTTITNWENGRCGPTLRLIPRIVDFLGTEPPSGGPLTLGNRIKQNRKLMGISQRCLALEIGIDPTTLGRLERDQRVSPTVTKKLTNFLMKAETGTQSDARRFARAKRRSLR